MLLEFTNFVTEDNGPRPAGKPDECFYCQQPLGGEHAQDCTLRLKVVMVKIELTMPRVVPASWDTEMVDFHLNDSSWCSDNIGNDIMCYLDAKEEGAPCLCGKFYGTCLGDATTEDLKGLDLVKLSADN